ncbi:YD repeat protein [Saprospira grandis str. Lewin]|uniref:YD repeat protein n=1 Tax=Saprospira grandis (strain Lewin) TaxID=984262 RepID=H6L741_SAPGL|nr:YD repeat protein [Saprospira grandis str. Lewin]
MEELHLYGSARLGILKKALALRYRDESGTVGLPAGSLLKTALAQSSYQQLELGRRRYELSNHLGNVLATVSDKSLGQDSSQTGQADYYLAQVSSASLYYPFGWEMPGRKFVSGEEYRFGFNGQEEDNEVGGDGNYLSFGNYGYNTRTGRRWQIDPVEQIGVSRYSVFNDNPNYHIDPDGNIPIPAIVGGIWLLVEAGLTAYDAYDVAVTVTDPNKSTAEKVTTTTLALGGLVLPGGGYSSLDNIAKYGDEVLDAAKYGDEILDIGKHGDDLVESRRAGNQFMKDADFSKGFTKGWWNKQVKKTTNATKTSNYLGEAGEKALNTLYPGGKAKKFDTKKGGRIIDSYNPKTKVAREAKVGYLSPGSSAEKRALAQLDKDIELLKEGDIEESVWTFFRSPVTGKVGASPKFLDAVKKAQNQGIDIKTEISDIKISLPKEK